jgi:uncharacterized OsmC-like protein
VPYTHFWHQYVQTHAGNGARQLALDPTAALVVAICACLLLAWTLRQASYRCDQCRHWPVRCRCSRPAEPRR